MPDVGEDVMAARPGQHAINACIAVAGLAVLLVMGIAGLGLTGPRST